MQLFQSVFFGWYSEGNHTALDHFYISFIFSDTMLYLMRYENYNDLIFKNNETCQLNIIIARCMQDLSNYYAGLGEVCLSNMYCLWILVIYLFIAEIFSFVKQTWIKENNENNKMSPLTVSQLSKCISQTFKERKNALGHTKTK